MEIAQRTVLICGCCHKLSQRAISHLGRSLDLESVSSIKVESCYFSGQATCLCVEASSFEQFISILVSTQGDVMSSIITGVMQFIRHCVRDQYSVNILLWDRLPGDQNARRACVTRLSIA